MDRDTQRRLNSLASEIWDAETDDLGHLTKSQVVFAVLKRLQTDSELVDRSLLEIAVAAVERVDKQRQAKPSDFVQLAYLNRDSFIPVGAGERVRLSFGQPIDLAKYREIIVRNFEGVKTAYTNTLAWIDARLTAFNSPVGKSCVTVEDLQVVVFDADDVANGQS